MNEENSKVTEFQAAQQQKEEAEAKKLQEELEQERKERLRKYIINTAIVLACMGIFGIIAFNDGKKSVRDETNTEITKMQEEVTQIQDEANAKVARLEQKLQQEYIDKKYALIEEQYEVFSALKDDSMLPEYRIRLCMDQIQWNHGVFIELGDDALDDLVLDDVGYPSFFSSDIKKVDDEKALEYINTLKKIAEKYPYSIDINHSVIHRIELLEERWTEQLQKAETFEEIDALKKQCEANMALWEIE